MKTKLAVIFLLLIAPVVSAEETLDRILVIVNDEIITERDLSNAVEPVAAQYRATLSGRDLEAKVTEARKAFLEQLVGERLIKSASKREKIEVNEKEVDDMVSDVRKKFPTQEVFDRVIRDQGLTHAQLRERFRDQILSRRMIDLKVKSQITISPGEIRDFYDAHSGEFKGPEKAKVSQILVRVGDERTETEAKDIADNVIQELAKGGDFATLAKLYSEASEAEAGGDMGWIERGQMVEAIDREIFKLVPGRHSQPVKSQLGLHVFKVEEKTESEARSFEQVRNRIQGILYRQKSEERVQAWLTELKRDAYINYQS